MQRTLILTLLALPVAAQGSDLDAFLLQKMREAHTPGLSAAIVHEDRILWTGAYGLADVAGGTPVTAQTTFNLASISKTIVGTAVMQLVEAGVVRLDDPADDGLVFRAENPAHPGKPFTNRQLLAHVSGLRDNWQILDSLYVQGDSPIPLGRFVQAYIEPGGSFFDPSKNFAPWPPAKKFMYSNEGFALLGAAVEGASGMSFESYCERSIFQPLGMTGTAWRLADLDPALVALPHRWDAGQQAYVSYGHYGYPDYPSGLLRTSASELARFLLAHMGAGTWRGAKILEPASVAQMQTVQYPAVDGTQGLAFYYWNHSTGTRLGHSGGDLGVTTEMWFRPGDRTGVIMLSNGEPDYGPWFQMLDRLFDEAQRAQ
jgi:CubicO group peptidase (beta-lactamase class C family)